MIILIFYSIGRIRTGLRNVQATQTQISIIVATQEQLSIIGATQMFSETTKVVDEYLTAVENQYWWIAYDYLCAEIKAKIRSPEEMLSRTRSDAFHYSIPDGHAILNPSGRSCRVLFVLFNTERNWIAGPYKAKLEKKQFENLRRGIRKWRSS
jgi:hypothetical protein